MATIVAPPPILSDQLSLFQTTDPLLSNSPVLVFHGTAATLGSLSSRIQVHVITPAGLGSYPRLSISPNSPFYAAVSNLPREEQGDEVCRGIAFGLKKYFAELPDGVKKAWCAQAKGASPTALFGDHHVAILATRMLKVENMEEAVADLTDAFGEQKISWLDVDVVLPPNTIKGLPKHTDSTWNSEEMDERDMLRAKYGQYADVIGGLGEPAFLPTSKLKRAPSKATAIGRSTSFMRQQKETVRRELEELVTTEENYIQRLSELNDLATQLQADLEINSDKRLADIFPSCIKSMQEINRNFLDALHETQQSTESTAIRDIECTADELPSAPQIPENYTSDTQGVGAFAKCLCDWFPQLADPYRDYLQRHSTTSQTARSVLREDSSVALRLQEVGEQKLTSLLIEPVQRLPRYNLYIDGIVKQLPFRHPAIKSLLKARDIITHICEEDYGNATTTVVEKLKLRVSEWPANTTLNGRLITTVDFVQMSPPYNSDRLDGPSGILLLFTDGIAMLRKKLHSSINARILLAELESMPLSTSVSNQPSDDLQLIRIVKLDALECTESHNGHALQLYTFLHLDAEAIPSLGPTLDSCTLMWLQNPYDGKASRFVEELCKARIEGCFAEPERESPLWELRATESLPDTLGLFSAIFEESNPDFVAARRTAASVRIIVDVSKHAKKARPGKNGVRTVIGASPGNDGLWCISVDSTDGSMAREFVNVSAISHTIRKKLVVLAGARLSIDQSSLSDTLLRKNAAALRAISLSNTSREEESEKPQLAPRERFHRPMSPKKLLSSFLSSVGPGSEAPALPKRDVPVLQGQSQIPRMQPPTSHKPPSRESRPSSKDQATPVSVSSTHSTDLFTASSKRLEEILSAYILALQARKGNIVGKNLNARKTAGELSVNELYNGLLDNPNMMVLAAQAPVDVLFAAFEKFVNVAWAEQFGPIVAPSVFQEVQSKAETMFPIDFDEYFRKLLLDLPPQNRRAFKSVMSLLADLLDGTGNDSDRGTLTAAFTEVLVTEGDPHDYIALIDRFVDDTETYFGEPLENGLKQRDAPKQSNSVTSASFSSNASSLRRKFGFGTLSRENSKSEQESRVAAVWRTLSKNSRFEAGQSRVQASDVDTSWSSSRPSSQDSKKAFRIGDIPFVGRTPSSDNLGSSTIGEHPVFTSSGHPRKKRRSSLSDLKSLQTSPRLDHMTFQTPRQNLLTRSNTGAEKATPAIPLITTTVSKGSTAPLDPNLDSSPRSRLPTSLQKENSPVVDQGQAPQRPKTSGGAKEISPISTRPTSNIPSLSSRSTSPQKRTQASPERNGLSERHGAGNIVKKPSPQPEKLTRPKSSSVSHSASSSPKKLRMQSPQKLRDRMYDEQRAIVTTQTSLQDELDKIGEEITTSAVSGRMGPPAKNPKSSIRGSMSQNSTSMELAQRVLKMEGQLSTQIEELNRRLSTIQSDLTTSLGVSESKCKKLDELYREANSENEAVYARFNDELSRILKAVRAGEGVEELKKKLKENQEEVAKLRRENGRLKRENVGLRAQLKE